MRRSHAALLFTVALSLASSPAIAQERTGDAALGALSGALVLGPIGAVAGALVGYTSGPDIAHAWGLRSSPHRTRRPAATAAHAPKADAAPLPKARPDAAPSVKAPEPMRSAGTAALPPVQSLE